MAQIPESRLPKAGPWPQGINNLAPEGAMPLNEFGTRPLALREAENVDISKEGRVTRRRGYDDVLDAATLVHSLWSDPTLGFGLFVDDGALFVLNADESVRDLGVHVGALPLSYTLINDRIYYSSAVACGLLTPDLQAWSWAPESPAGQPNVTAVTGYGLFAGAYQVAVTFVDALGRESGTPRAVQVEVPENHGLQLSDIPVPLDTLQTPLVNVYLSDANDTVLRRYTTLPAGVTALLISMQVGANSPMLDTQHLTPLPPGQIVRGHNGRQYVADGKYLRWSETMRYGLTKAASNVINFGSEITLLEPCGAGDGSAGLYLGTKDQVFWLAGRDPATFEKRRSYAAGVIPRTAVYVPGAVIGANDFDYVPVWLANDGQYCVGKAGGSVSPLNVGRAVVDNASAGASMFVGEAGRNQVVTSLRGAQRQGLAVSDRAVAHVVHTPR